mmetsp:Transcript_22533/g.70747  ORF Transcript_22533/g.70747 Transcript_22533/m.70747 type:complete len:202 (+) Transcript_22533:24-629(+)
MLLSPCPASVNQAATSRLNIEGPQSRAAVSAAGGGIHAASSAPCSRIPRLTRTAPLPSPGGSGMAPPPTASGPPSACLAAASCRYSSSTEPAAAGGAADTAGSAADASTSKRMRGSVRAASSRRPSIGTCAGVRQACSRVSAGRARAPAACSAISELTIASAGVMPDPAVTKPAAVNVKTPEPPHSRACEGRRSLDGPYAP